MSIWRDVHLFLFGNHWWPYVSQSCLPMIVTNVLILLRYHIFRLRTQRDEFTLLAEWLRRQQRKAGLEDDMTTSLTMTLPCISPSSPKLRFLQYLSDYALTCLPYFSPFSLFFSSLPVLHSFTIFSSSNSSLSLSTTAPITVVQQLAAPSAPTWLLTPPPPAPPSTSPAPVQSLRKIPSGSPYSLPPAQATPLSWCVWSCPA